MKTYLALIGGLVLVTIGSLLGFEQVSAYARQPGAPVEISYEVRKNLSHHPASYVGGKPVRITIPSVGIDVPVIDGVYNYRSKTWTLTESSAQYALITPEANNTTGNTFIYAHNRHQLFGPLLSLQSGATATVYTNNGHRFIYRLNGSRVTKPSDDSLFDYQGPSMLTLQTCSGLWFQNRSLYSFDFVEVQ